jgi:hypothetical protein
MLKNFFFLDKIKMDFEEIKNNHALHALGIGVLTSIALRGRTDKNLHVGGALAIGSYWYMATYGHTAPVL